MFFPTGSVFPTGPGWPRPFTTFHGLAGPDRSEKNTRPYFELISQLGKLVWGRPEAERFFPTVSFLRPV